MPKRRAMMKALRTNSREPESQQITPKRDNRWAYNMFLAQQKRLKSGMK
jgi:hypothetical protein